MLVCVDKLIKVAHFIATMSTITKEKTLTLSFFCA